MKIKTIIIIVFVVTLFISCDCLVHIQGVVVDSKTRLPIDSVLVKGDVYCYTCDLEDIYTDSLGHFEYNSMVGGFCPKSTLSFEKEGYEKKIKKYRSYYRDDSVTIALKSKK
jgi:hypothetical protein